MLLESKNAVIYGGGGSIGGAVARSFAREGASVFLAGRTEPRLEEFRWLLEELSVSLFAQELKTPYPVSYKRLERAWGDLDR